MIGNGMQQFMTLYIPNLRQKCNKAVSESFNDVKSFTKNVILQHFEKQTSCLLFNDTTELLLIQSEVQTLI